jgi:iron(III) transport system permease protein
MRLRAGHASSDIDARRRKAWRGFRTHATGITLIIVLGYMTLWPLVQLQLRGLRDGAAGYVSAYSTADLGKTILVTAFLAIGALVIGVVLGGVLAFASLRLGPGYRWMAILPIFPLVVPPSAAIVGWSLMLAPNSGMINAAIRSLPFWPGNITKGPFDVYTVPWIVIITGIGLSSFVYLFLRNGLQRVNAEHIEAGLTSGSSRLKVYAQIVLPIIRPSIVYGIAVALLLGLGQFAAPLMLGLTNNIKVLATEVFRFTSQAPADYGAAAAIATPLLFAGLIIVVLQKFLLSDPRRFVVDSGKGGRFGQKPSKFAPVIMATFALLVTVLPVVALALASVSPFWDGTFDVGAMTLRNFEALFASAPYSQSIQTSLVVSVLAVAIAIPLGYIIADRLVSDRTPASVKWLLDLIVTIPLGVPAVVFGAGFFFTYTQPPFRLYGTIAVLVVVYVTIMLPFATRMQLAARMSLGPHFQAAARVSGAGLLRSHVGIVMPMLRSSIAGSAALIFVLMTHEFAASMLVRSPQIQVMGTILYDMWTLVSFPMVAAMGLVMCVITAAGVSLALLAGGTKSMESL